MKQRLQIFFQWTLLYFVKSLADICCYQVHLWQFRGKVKYFTLKLAFLKFLKILRRVRFVVVYSTACCAKTLKGLNLQDNQCGILWTWPFFFFFGNKCFRSPLLISFPSSFSSSFCLKCDCWRGFILNFWVPTHTHTIFIPPLLILIHLLTYSNREISKLSIDFGGWTQAANACSLWSIIITYFPVAMPVTF